MTFHRFVRSEVQSDKFERAPRTRYQIPRRAILHHLLITVGTHQSLFMVIASDVLIRLLATTASIILSKVLIVR